MAQHAPPMRPIDDGGFKPMLWLKVMSSDLPNIEKHLGVMLDFFNPNGLGLTGQLVDKLGPPYGPTAMLSGLDLKREIRPDYDALENQLNITIREMKFLVIDAMTDPTWSRGRDGNSIINEAHNWWLTQFELIEKVARPYATDHRINTERYEKFILNHFHVPFADEREAVLDLFWEWKIKGAELWKELIRLWSQSLYQIRHGPTRLLGSKLKEPSYNAKVLTNMSSIIGSCSFKTVGL
jgi:hypothetical protein